MFFIRSGIFKVVAVHKASNTCEMGVASVVKAVVMIEECSLCGIMAIHLCLVILELINCAQSGQN